MSDAGESCSLSDLGDQSLKLSPLRRGAAFAQLQSGFVAFFPSLLDPEKRKGPIVRVFRAPAKR